MMMLIVFTAMLGYERKTAVGTSTFIMTFTALIASVSHMLIEPAIVYECRNFLLISIVVATLFSLLSARFANRVNGRTVGYVTGVILLVLGLSMIAINHLDRWYLLAFARLFGIYIGYIVALAAILIVVRFTTRVPDYIFRKLLHFVAFTSILPLVFGTDIWWIAAAVEGVFLLLVMSPLPWRTSLVFALVIAPAAALTELFTPKGWDTVSVPVVSALLLSAALL